MCIYATYILYICIVFLYLLSNSIDYWYNHIIIITIEFIFEWCYKYSSLLVWIISIINVENKTTVFYLKIEIDTSSVFRLLKIEIM